MLPSCDWSRGKEKGSWRSASWRIGDQVHVEAGSARVGLIAKYDLRIARELRAACELPAVAGFSRLVMSAPKGVVVDHGEMGALCPGMVGFGAVSRGWHAVAREMAQR